MIVTVFFHYFFTLDFSSGTATVVFKNGNSLLNSSSSGKNNSAPITIGASAGSSSSTKAALNDSVEIEDDMMDFLTDDSNF